MTGKLEGMEKEAQPTAPCNPNNCLGCLTEKYNPVTVHGLSSEVKIPQDIQPHNTIRILQPYSHTIQTGHLKHTATQYKQDTSNIQPHNTNRTPQTQATQYKKDTSNMQPHNTNRVPQPYSHKLQTGHLKLTATQYKQNTSNIQPHNIKRVPQPYSHTV